MDLIIIGNTLKPKGLNGELRVAIKDQYLELLPKLSVLFLNLNGTSVPYFPEQFNVDSGLIKLEEVDTPETAKKLSSKEILVRREDIPFDPTSIGLEVTEYSHLKEFTIVDELLGDIGTILDVLEYPQQEMALLEIDNHEVLIPLNDTYITSVDEDKRQVFMNLPDGLIDLHTSNDETP